MRDEAMEVLTKSEDGVMEGGKRERGMARLSFRENEKRRWRERHLTFLSLSLEMILSSNDFHF